MARKRRGMEVEMGRRGREDEKETKKQLALGFQVRKELALFVHVNFFFFHGLLFAKL